jgi:hypothetical protein
MKTSRDGLKKQGIRFLPWNQRQVQFLFLSLLFCFQCSVDIPTGLSFKFNQENINGPELCEVIVCSEKLI